MHSVCARAYASVANLGYGFDVLAACVGAGYDEVEIGIGRSGSRLEVEGEEAGRITRRMERNTAGLALRALMRDHGLRRPVHLRVRKGVPTGGLGSSGASAAAAVVAANRLFGLGLSRERLVAYAAQGERASAGAAHADNVAASLFGGVVIVEKRAPGRVTRLRAPRALRFAIATPRWSLTTAAARRALPRRLSLEEYSQGCARTAMLVAALAAGDVRSLGRAVEGSFSDRARARLIPGFAEVCAGARRAGAAGVTLSGAGPSMLAVVDAERSDPRRVCAAMERAFQRAGLEVEGMVASVAGGARVIGVR